MLLIVFGLAGSGKTYISNLITKHFDFHGEDADQWLPQDMKDAIIAKEPLTSEMRTRFVSIIIKNISALQKKGYKNLVISQGLYRQENRQTILKAFPEAKFLEVETNPSTIYNRLITREDWVDPEYAASIAKYFQPMQQADILNNDLDGDESILNKLKTIIG